MNKILKILENLLIVVLLFVAVLIAVMIVYRIKKENLDTSYMWNIQFNNLDVAPGSKEGEINLKDNNLSLNIVFEEELEFYEFTFDVVNSGTLDARVDQVILAVKSDDNIIKGNVMYDDGKEIKEGDILSSGDTMTIRVRIDYPKQEKKIYDALKLSMNFDMKFSAIYGD